MFVLSLSHHSLHLIPPALFFSTLVQLVLATTQFLRGQSLQGLFYYLGERHIALGQPGVATASFFGETVLRAYGTFSHPNTLAGWFVVVFLIVRQLSSSTAIRTITFICTIVAILLTQSRSAGLAFFGLIIPLTLLRSLHSRLLYFFLATILVVNFSLLNPSRSSLSTLERLHLQQSSFTLLSQFPVFGTGAQASISVYPTQDILRLLQPDHNSFTLLLSWIGFFGLLSIIIILKKSLFPLARTLIVICPLLLFDHYLLSSPQGLLIFLVYLKVVNYSHVQNHSQ